MTVIDGASGSATYMSVPLGPWGFAGLNAISVNEANNKIYVVDNMSTNLVVIDGATNQMSLIPLAASYPFGATINPVTNKVYVSHLNDGIVSIISE